MKVGNCREQPPSYPPSRTPSDNRSGNPIGDGAPKRIVSNNGLLCQPEVGFQAEPGVVSIWVKGRVLTLPGCPSIFFGFKPFPSNNRRVNHF